MCQSLHAMYEGKNIHYSAVDNKPLCSFSSKLCNQRRLNGYAFCVRHILEDRNAPFKRCAYVAKSSNQMCTQPIPEHEERLYCNNHMQVLGMLPRKERKPKNKKEEVNVVHHDKLSFQDRVKSKYISKIKSDVDAKPVSVDDPDDPYAFPDPVRDSQSVNNTAPQLTQTLEVPKQPQQSPNSRAKSPGDGGSTIAKLYPELAEKLEKIKPKVEPKVKGRIRSSRTMNKLQTKIAQNKIKDKLRKSQESGSNPSVSPASLPSPDPAPVPNQHQPPLNLIAGQSPMQIAPPPLVRYDGALNLPLRPPITPHTPPVNVMGLPQEVNHTLSPLAARLSPHILPPPYPGLMSNRLPSGPVPSQTQVPMPVSNVVHQQPSSTTPVITHSFLPQTPLVAPPPPVTDVGLPPPPPYVAPSKPPALSSLNPSVSVLPSRPQRLKNICVKRDTTKVKTNSAVSYYACYAKRKRYNHYYANSGLCSSSEDESDEERSDLLPWNPGCFSASSDDDNEEEQDGSLPIHVRATKLALLRTKLRRQCYQTRKAACTNTTLQTYKNGITLALIKSARDSPVTTVKTLYHILKNHRKELEKHKSEKVEHRPCLYKNDDDEKCSHRALPFTNHCLKHIMYNVDQQLFDYCTAKFADNTQCCVPVFDIRHGLPLCAEHGAKVDNHQKSDVDIKKRPRKKTKPPALTRPPKKGKKKKKNRNLRPQKPIPPSEPTGDNGTFSTPVSDDDGEDADIEVDQNQESNDARSEDAGVESPAVSLSPAPKTNMPSPEEKPETVNTEDIKKEESLEEKVDIDHEVGVLSNVTLEEMLPPSGRIEDIDRVTFGLPLEQASRLLEEQDFQDVFNKIPDEAFDIFSGKNGECPPTIQETEELERALAAVTKDVYSTKDMLEKITKGDTLDELGTDLKTLAETLLAHTSHNTLEALSSEVLASPDGLNVLARTQPPPPVPNINMGFSQAQTSSSNNAAILSRLQSGFPQTQPMTVAYNGAVTSGSTITVGGQPANIAGFQNATLGAAQNIATTQVNRTVPQQRGLQNSQGVAHVGYHGNLPYSALSQHLAMSQQTPKGQALANPGAGGQLHLDSQHVLPHSSLPQQPAVHSQTIIPQQIAGTPRPQWQQQQVTSTTTTYQNGFPGPVTQAPFIQSVNLAGGQVGKFPTSAQSNLTEFVGKQDTHFAATTSVTHSIGVAPPPNIRPPVVQGLVNATNFTSGLPPFTSSSSGS